MITESQYGLNGYTVGRFLDGMMADPMAYRQFVKTILPGVGQSTDRLQPFRSLSPMGLITDEATVDEVDPKLGHQVVLEAKERGAQVQLTKTKLENAGADQDNLVGGLLFELGQLGPVTLGYIFDLWLSAYAFDGTTTGLGVSGGDGEAFFSDSHTRYSGDGTGNDNLLGTQNFNATGFGAALIKLHSQLDTKGNTIHVSNDLALVYGPSLIVRVQEFLGSIGKPGEMSNTVNIAANYQITPYLCNELTSTNSKEFYWALFDKQAMVAQSGSGLNMKIMRYPGVYPSKSRSGLVYYYTNTLRAGIGSGTATFGVGCTGTA